MQLQKAVTKQRRNAVSWKKVNSNCVLRQQNRSLFYYTAHSGFTCYIKLRPAFLAEVAAYELLDCSQEVQTQSLHSSVATDWLLERCRSLTDWGSASGMRRSAGSMCLANTSQACPAPVWQLVAVVPKAPHSAQQPENLRFLLTWIAVLPHSMRQEFPQLRLTVKGRKFQYTVFNVKYPFPQIRIMIYRRFSNDFIFILGYLRNIFSSNHFARVSILSTLQEKAFKDLQWSIK